MKRIFGLMLCVTLLMLVPPTFVSAQQSPPRDRFGDDISPERGATVFAQNCVACHGQEAKGGTAPALAGRGLDAQYINDIVWFGGARMPAWGQALIQGDVKAVVAYVASLNGIAPSGNGSARPLELSSRATQGSDLFFDTQGELGRCSGCHKVNGKGVSVALPIKNVPPDVTGLRNLSTRQVSTATVDGETFPALVVMRLPNEAKLYDLTKGPPVLRTVSPSALTITEGSSWRHSAVLGTYSDAELDEILGFLHEISRP
jgi:mono/diheme cytochrome c family protein